MAPKKNKGKGVAKEPQNQPIEPVLRRTYEIEVDGTPEAYQRVIENIRVQMTSQRVRCLGTTKPILSQNPSPKRTWFGVQLKAKAFKVMLLIDNENLYLTAFKPNESNTWFELSLPADELPVDPIKGSHSLGIGSSYYSLGNVSNCSEDDLRFNRSSLMNCVTTLAKVTLEGQRGASSSKQHREPALSAIAKSVMTMIVFICESIRFTHITGGATLRMVDDTSLATFEKGYSDIFRVWGQISQVLITADNGATVFKFQNHSLTVESLVEMVGVLLPQRVNYV